MIKDESIYLAMLAALDQHDLAELFGKALQSRAWVGGVVCWDTDNQRITSAMIIPDTWRGMKPNMTLGEELSLMAGFIDALSDEENRTIFPGGPVEEA